MTQRLPVEPISRASADQRAGRCGRVGPGVCLRLYSQKDYESRPRYTTPEIPAHKPRFGILQTKALRLGGVGAFPLSIRRGAPQLKTGIKLFLNLGRSTRNAGLPRSVRLSPGSPSTRALAEFSLPPAPRARCGKSCRSPLRSKFRILANVRARKQEAADLKHAQFLDEIPIFFPTLNFGISGRILRQRRREASCVKHVVRIFFPLTACANGPTSISSFIGRSVR